MNRTQLLRKTIRTIVESSDERRTINAIYCDMDGVLVDFEQGAVKLVSDILKGIADPEWTSGSKSIEKNIKKLRETLGDDWHPTAREDLDEKTVRQVMLSSISSNPGQFFKMLSPFKDGITELWPFLNSLGLPVHILSAPVYGRGMTAAEGKTIWIKEYLHPQPSSIIIVPAVDKQHYAIANGAPNLLVDDKVSTIVTWNELNGVGVLHEPGNSSKSINEIESRVRL